MLAETIRRETRRLKAKLHTADPYEICAEMRIRIELQPMGTNPGSCKGFFLTRFRKKVITLNSDLPEEIRRIILIHELGHAVLHSSLQLCEFHEFSFMCDTNRLEYEANIFAAEFILEDDEVLEAVKEENDYFRCAQILSVPPEVLDFKLRLMERRGFELNAPHIANSDFLKRDLSQPLI